MLSCLVSLSSRRILSNFARSWFLLLDSQESTLFPIQESYYAWQGFDNLSRTHLKSICRSACNPDFPFCFPYLDPFLPQMLRAYSWTTDSGFPHSVRSILHAGWDTEKILFLFLQFENVLSHPENSFLKLLILSFEEDKLLIIFILTPREEVIVTMGRAAVEEVRRLGWTSPWLLFAHQ